VTIISIIVTLLIFTVIVVVHEFGHFIVAKKNDIMVEEFAVGMGPVLFSKKKGETLYSVRLLPIGGFCKMLGEEDGDNDPRSFSAKKVWQRIAVCIAGVVMNFILAVVLGIIVISATYLRDTTITEVTAESPAATAGIQAGDKITKIDGKRVFAYEYIGHYVNAAGGDPVEVTLKRNGENVTTTVTPYNEPIQGLGNRYYLGIMAQVKAGVFSDRETKEAFPPAGIIETVKYAFGRSMYYITMVVDSLGMMVRGEVRLNDMAGPIGIGQMVDSNLQAAAQTETALKASVIFALNLAILLSANLAVINLLPIPALDGGRIVFLIIEGIRRRPMDPEKEGWIHLVGFALVMVLALVVAFNDIGNLINFENNRARLQFMEPGPV